MDRRQRINDHEETFRIGFESQQAQIWNALPGIIKSFDSDDMTCAVQPAISGIVQAKDGTVKSQRLPVLLDCPVVFPGGGGCVLTFPLTEGDECLVVFASRCIDSWWAIGGVQGQAEFRMHDLSDGFVIPGPRSRPKTVSVAGKTQLRTDSGSVYLEIDDSGIKIVGNVQIQGNLTVSGVTKTNTSLNLNTHTHGGIEPGGANTSGPNS